MRRPMLRTMFLSQVCRFSLLILRFPLRYKKLFWQGFDNIFSSFSLNAKNFLNQVQNSSSFVLNTISDQVNIYDSNTFCYEVQ